MRHLFYIHSPIARLLAHAIIAHEQLGSTDVAFLTDRGQAVAPPRTLDVSDWRWYPLRERAHNYAQLDRLDAWLDRQLGGGPLAFYLRHHLLSTLRAVVSHPRCVRFHYVEEGIDSYQSAAAHTAIHRLGPAPLAQRLVARFKYRGRIAATRSFYAANDARFADARGYGLSPDVFPDLPRKVLLPPPFPVEERYRTIGHVLAPSPESEVGYYPLEDQLAVIARLLAYLERRGVDLLHIKFHPRQIGAGGSAAAFRALFGRWRDRLRVVELPPDTALESVAVSSEAAFYVGTSSVGLYAALCGRVVYSYADELVRQNAVYARIAERLPAAFHRAVIPLQLTARPH